MEFICSHTICRAELEEEEEKLLMVKEHHRRMQHQRSHLATLLGSTPTQGDGKNDDTGFDSELAQVLGSQQN